MTKRHGEKSLLGDDSLWFKDAIIYQLHVRAFLDSNSDGIGDFGGLSEKLDYLQDLGVTALWLLPFCPSPLRDDGYDIADYTGIHPDYGTLRDFKTFLREAHKRGLRVITELVLNHTSDQHAWFQRARRAKVGSKWRDFYVWSDTADRYNETRIIFKDFETSNWAWDPVAKAYYWHRFYSHQPDLNYDNPHVQKTMFRAIDFWFRMGVDGLRLDAVPYLYEREGTNCENLPETHEFLKKLRAYVDNRYTGRMLLAEANQWPEDAVAYFAEGNECHMAYHFPLMPRLFMALRQEDRYPIIDILEQTPAIPDNCQWAMFLRNHDELTLEMVTDEERDYMYRVYASDPRMRINLGIRRRLAPLLGNHRRRIELMNGLLYSLPGSPIIYYGDEIGMGDNVYLGDRNGVRTPMQWSSDRNAGFSRANPQQLYLPVIIDPEYHYEATNVEAQQNSPHSLLWWMRRSNNLRRRFKAFSRGEIDYLHPENHKVLAFIRSYQNERILVVANLSRYSQFVELDLAKFRGMVPVEVYGRTEFPLIREEPYFLSLGPHSFYWFALVPDSVWRETMTIETGAPRLQTLAVATKWDSVFQGKSKEALEEILPRFLLTRRWFGGKARQIKWATIGEVLPVPNGPAEAVIVLVRVEYMEGDGETYTLPLTYASGKTADKVMREHGYSVLARLELTGKDEEGILYDAVVDTDFCLALLESMARRRKRKGAVGELQTTSLRTLQKIRPELEGPLDPSILQAEQSNTSVVFSKKFILKLFRKLEPGINPDLEVGRFLTEHGFPHIPQVAGAIEYRKARQEATTLAILHSFVPNQGDAWEYTRESLGEYYTHAMMGQAEAKSGVLPQKQLLDLVGEDTSPQVLETIGTYAEAARLLGQRTGELHLALASAPEDPNFAPESFSKLYQRSLYQSTRNLTGRVFQLLRRSLNKLPESLQSEAKKVLDREREIMDRFRSVSQKKISAMRLRCHGDYHLGQVLWTGKDFVIMDFEGEPARPIAERRIKRSPLRDVAGMLRSFHYAAYRGLFDFKERRGIVLDEELAAMDFWARFWHLWVCVIFLKAYMKAAISGKFLPESRKELRTLLDMYLLEKAIYEMGYELNNRPEWVRIPLRGILQLLESA
ncbi:MAG: maltose alpha-D-glucosyltransferase [Deltaproteobacteria bacterium]|nr:MAG: maltose alpha-D-glucosyltransferase [Deltaproteobacteria bacterium]